MNFAVLCGLSVLMAATAVSTQAADQQTSDTPKDHQVCVYVSNIDHFSFPDDKTILFHMKSGKVRIWKNTLKHACPNMKFQGGIAYEVHGDTICGNMQMFTVIKYNNPCMMGTFTPYTPPKKDKKS